MRAAILLLGVVSLSSYANIAITTVTNQQTATNGCTVISVAGGSNFVVWGVQCPSENGKTVNVMTTWNGSLCTAQSVTTGYITSQNCSNYTVYRVTSSSSLASSSRASSSSVSCTTQYINIGQTCDGSYWCAESFGRACSAAGGSVAVGYGSYYCKKQVCQ